MKFRIFNSILAILFLAFYSTATSCGGDSNGSNVNSNFASVDNGTVMTSTTVEPDNTDQVQMVAAGEGDQNGVIGEIEPVNPNQVLCIIIDPKDGDLADLEVCEKDKANDSADSVNGICPEADQETRCASFNEGSGPDFCQVTGDREYIFIILNFTGEEVTVAYQVIDVTDQPNKSCADLNITEDSITADN